MLVIPTKKRHMHVYQFFELMRSRLLIFKQRMSYLTEPIAYWSFLFIKGKFLKKSIQDRSCNEALNNGIHEASVSDVIDTSDQCFMSFFGTHLNLGLLIIFNSDIFSINFKLITIRVAFEMKLKLVLFLFSNNMSLSHLFNKGEVAKDFISKI